MRSVLQANSSENKVMIASKYHQTTQQGECFRTGGIRRFAIHIVDVPRCGRRQFMNAPQ